MPLEWKEKVWKLSPSPSAIEKSIPYWRCPMLDQKREDEYSLSELISTTFKCAQQKFDRMEFFRGNSWIEAAEKRCIPLFTFINFWVTLPWKNLEHFSTQNCKTFLLWNILINVFDGSVFRYACLHISVTDINIAFSISQSFLESKKLSPLALWHLIFHFPRILSQFFWTPHVFPFHSLEELQQWHWKENPFYSRKCKTI